MQITDSKILTVSELTKQIKHHLEANWYGVSIKGEISNLKIQTSGHIYFTLKDKDAQISAVLFRGSQKATTPIPKEGDQIIAKGSLSVYLPRGSYQLIVQEIEPCGNGQLLLQFQELKQKLQSEGLFAPERKRKLPHLPKTVGVITSPTGAVILDIIQILQRRHKGFHLILYPVKVQGDGAREELTRAIQDFNKYKIADVLILARGGGSLEDLWAFNEEMVVRAIAASQIPTISAIGHETDFSLTDFVADLRAPTPSAAAEIVLAEKTNQILSLLRIRQGLHRALSIKLLNLKTRLLSLKKNPYISSSHLILSHKMQQLDDLKSNLDVSINTFFKNKKMKLHSLEKQKSALSPFQKLQVAKERLRSIRKTLNTSLQRHLQLRQKIFSSQTLQAKFRHLTMLSLQKKRQDLERLRAHLSSIDPRNLLAKGYCILFSEKKDSVILSTEQLSLQQTVQILLKDGLVTAKTEEIIYGKHL